MREKNLNFDPSSHTFSILKVIYNKYGIYNTLLRYKTFSYFNVKKCISFAMELSYQHKFNFGSLPTTSNKQ